MVTKADLAAAFARMNSNNAEADSYVASPIDNVYGRNLGARPTLAAPEFGRNASSSDGEPLWQKALTGLFAPGKVITNQIANWTDHKIDWKDIPTLESFVHGAKGQWDAWTDGKAGFGDIPGLGFIHGIGDKGKGFDSTLSNLGAKEGGKVAKWGGLAGDLVLDPLNLLTFGGASAVKAGAKAAQIAARAEAKAAGLAGKFAAHEVPGAIYDAVQAKHAGSAINPNLVERLAFKKAGAAQKIAEDAGKAARNTAQNAIFSRDIPFTTKGLKQYGQKANIPLVGKYLHKTDAAIGAGGAAAVANAFAKLGLDPESGLAKQLLKDVYKVDNAADLTKDGLKHFQASVDNFAPKFTDGNGAAKNFLNGHNIEELMSKVKNPSYNPKIDPNMNVGAYEEPFLDVMSRKVDAKPFDLNTTGGQFKRTLDEFVQDAGGKSKLGRAVDKVNPFNARAFHSTDELAKQSANDVRDATTRINGQTRQANEYIADVAKSMEGMSEAEKRAVIYETQNRYPKAFDKTSIDMAKVQTAAGKVKKVMDQIGQRDLASGTIKELRRKYFPHVIKKDGVNVDQLIQDPDIAKILGMTKSNNFGKARKGFQSIAEMDDVIAGLEKAAQAEPDVAKAEKLMAKADNLRNTFDTNVPSALGHRAYKSVRSSAYADLFKNLEKDGLMIRPARTRSATKIHADSNPEAYHKLDPSEAKVLGVEPGTMIHKDTFEGMQRVQDLFTVKGANKLLENMNSAVSVWKSLVTSYVPAHYFNNFVGNVANNTLAGVKPDSYIEAARLLKSMKSGSMSPEDIKIVQAAFDKGVFGSGYSSDFVKSQFGTTRTGMEKFADKVSNSKWSKFLRKYGEHGDDLARMALFQHGIKSTGSADKAAEMVRKYLFNYSERSHGDSIVRTVAPFWMWTKNNLPLQVQSFMQQPRYYETYKKIKDAFNEDVKGGQNKAYTTNNYLHLPGTKIGLSLNSLPMNNLDMFGAGSPLDPLRSTLGMLNPILKAPQELALNRQYFNNSPVYYKGEEAKGISNYLLNQTGAVGKAAHIADGQGSTLMELLGSLIGKPVEYK